MDIQKKFVVLYRFVICIIIFAVLVPHKLVVASTSLDTENDATTTTTTTTETLLTEALSSTVYGFIEIDPQPLQTPFSDFNGGLRYDQYPLSMTVTTTTNNGANGTTVTNTIDETSTDADTDGGVFVIQQCQRLDDQDDADNVVVLPSFNMLYFQPVEPTATSSSSSSSLLLLTDHAQITQIMVELLIDTLGLDPEYILAITVDNIPEDVLEVLDSAGISTKEDQNTSNSSSKGQQGTQQVLLRPFEEAKAAGDGSGYFSPSGSYPGSPSTSVSFHYLLSSPKDDDDDDDDDADDAEGTVVPNHVRNNRVGHHQFLDDFLATGNHPWHYYSSTTSSGSSGGDSSGSINSGLFFIEIAELDDVGGGIGLERVELAFNIQQRRRDGSSNSSTGSTTDGSSSTGGNSDETPNTLATDEDEDNEKDPVGEESSASTNWGGRYRLSVFTLVVVLGVGISNF